MTVTFIVNAVGGSEAKPVVVWKSDNPRCFKKVDKSQLPVHYYSQQKAWMTGDILDQVLSKISRTLRVNGHSVLLLMDNAGCHPEELQHKSTTASEVTKSLTILHTVRWVAEAWKQVTSIQKCFRKVGILTERVFKLFNL